MMAEPDTLLALAERCEAATAYDGRLMAEIDCAVRYSAQARPAEPGDHADVPGCGRFDPSAIYVPTGFLMSHNYWRSVDDAIGLVPPEHAWTIWQDGTAGCQRLPANEGMADGNVRAGTPAMALTAAALRARAAA